VLNGPEAMDAADNQVEVLDRSGEVVRAIAGSKEDVATGILAVVQRKLIRV
jgi:phosphopantothenoylcysteine decarboxylase / phosphopantothenate---cysteine ligase